MARNEKSIRFWRDFWLFSKNHDKITTTNLRSREMNSPIILFGNKFIN